MKVRSPFMLVAAAILGVAATAQQQQPPQPPPRPAGPVQRITLPLEFPAVGNVEAVKQWTFGRVERIEQIARSPDINVSIRTADGTVVRALGTATALDDLARASDWIRVTSRQSTGREDFVERMIAFEVDGQGRLVAVASLETINRNRNRLRTALGG